MVKELAKKYKQYVIDLRREFHMYPEKSMNEVRTQKRIIEELEKAGIECTPIAGTGVIATIKGKKDGKTVALRADIDALDMSENNDIPYKSKNEGLMHACGHDGHAASLLGAAMILNELKDEIQGSVKLLFQPGEEVAKGAKKMIEEGALENVDAIFGIHLWNDLECGKVSAEVGPRMASAGIFNIKVKGKGGHGSMPHQTIDPIVTASAIVLDLQSIVSREISPLDSAVITIGKFQSGTRFNVIANDALLVGTTRCFSNEINDTFEERIRRVCESTASAYRATAELEYDQLVIPTINDEACSNIAENAIEKLLNKEAIAKFPMTTGGEDFSFYTKDIPGAFAFVGTRNDEKVTYYPHHHPKFNIDEDGLEISSGLYAQFAIDYLNS